jgi:hypothetical protein
MQNRHDLPPCGWLPSGVAGDCRGRGRGRARGRRSRLDRSARHRGAVEDRAGYAVFRVGDSLRPLCRSRAERMRISLRAAASIAAIRIKMLAARLLGGSARRPASSRSRSPTIRRALARRLRRSPFERHRSCFQPQERLGANRSLNEPASADSNEVPHQARLRFSDRLR